MEAWIGNDQGLYILFYIFRVVNMASNEETQYFSKEEIYMIEVMTGNREVRLRKEDYEDYIVTGPNGVSASFWTALTEVIGEPWVETIIIKENSIILAGDLDK